MKLSRRAMIKDGMLVVSAGMVMPSIFSRGVASAMSQSLDGSRMAQTASDRTLIVVQMAKTQNQLFGSTEDYLVTREFERMASREQKLALLDCLFAVAAADRLTRDYER